jgi:hypothetical protein
MSRHFPHNSMTITTTKPETPNKVQASCKPFVIGGCDEGLVVLHPTHLQPSFNRVPNCSPCMSTLLIVYTFTLSSPHRSVTLTQRGNSTVGQNVKALIPAL